MEKLGITDTDGAGSKTVEELSEIPAIISAVETYEKAKNLCSLTQYGFGAVEWGLNFMADSLSLKSMAGTYLDSAAAERIADLKDSYPILQRRPTKIIRKTKSKSVKFFKKKTRSALNNFLGKCVVCGLDAMLWVSESTMKALSPHDSTSEKHVQTSPIRSGETEQEASKLPDESDRAWADKIAEEDQSIFDLMRRFVLFPVSVFVCFLKETKQFIRPPNRKNVSGVSRRSSRNIKTKTLTPEKMAEIGARRKVSPKKRLPSTSLLGSLKEKALRLIGFQTSRAKQTDIRRFLICSKHKPLNAGPLVAAEDKKRKHRSLSDDSESDEDLLTMDLDNYQSDEDPDYEPTDDETSDESIDSAEELSEGEFEVQQSKDGVYQMIKDGNENPLLKYGSNPADLRKGESPVDPWRPETSKSVLKKSTTDVSESGLMKPEARDQFKAMEKEMKEILQKLDVEHSRPQSETSNASKSSDIPAPQQRPPSISGTGTSNSPRKTKGSKQTPKANQQNKVAEIKENVENVEKEPPKIQLVKSGKDPVKPDQGQKKGKEEPQDPVLKEKNK